MGRPGLTGAVMWDVSGQASIIGALEADTSATATAVSRDGKVVVGYSTSPTLHQRAFRYTQQGGMEELTATDPTFTDLVASGVSGDGEVIVGWANTPNGETAIIWNAAHGLRRLVDLIGAERLELRGWNLLRCTGISDDGGTVIGNGIDSTGKRQGWIVQVADLRLL
jgi:probable HAF family extracellular repeat protein